MVYWHRCRYHYQQSFSYEDIGHKETWDDYGRENHNHHLELGHLELGHLELGHLELGHLELGHLELGHQVKQLVIAINSQALVYPVSRIW
ncbi:MAG: hypothetical protein R2880_07340 [Deinococcales bacterium]